LKAKSGIIFLRKRFQRKENIMNVITTTEENGTTVVEIFK
jgi:hypothetical protein